MAAIDKTATPPKAGFSPAETTLREKDAQGIDFVVVEPITWRGSFDGDHVQVTTSDRFTTDLASVPRFLTWVVPRYGQYTKAAIIHDYLCQQEPGPVDRGETYPAPYGPIELRDRSDADAVFRKMLAYVEVPWARQWLMWSAVTWATVITAVRTTITKPEQAAKLATWRPDVKPALFLAVVVVAVVIADILLFNVSWPLWVSMVVVAVVSFVVLAEALMVAGCMALHRSHDRGFSTPGARCSRASPVACCSPVGWSR